MAKQLMQQALDALRQCEFTSPPAQRPIVKDAITALRSALDASPATSADYAMGYAEGFNDACRPDGLVRETAIDFTVLYSFADEHRISYNKLCAAVRQALAAPAPVVPDGMALVPREPTPEMIIEGCRAVKPDGFIEDIYVAMIAAAPAPVVREPLTPPHMLQIGRKHFGHPTPKAWFDAARELEQAHGIGGGK